MKKASIITGYSCNNNCSFCYDGNKRHIKDMTTEEVKIKLLSARNNSCDYVDFLGGEFTIRKDSVSIIRYAKQLGFKTIAITTNGRLFSYETTLKKFIDAGMNSIIYSVHGHNSDLHDLMTNAKGSFSELTRAIDNSKKLLPIFTNTTITKMNYKFFPEICEYLIKIGSVNSEFIFVDPTGEAYNNFYQIVPKISEIQGYIKKGLDIGIKNKIKHWHIRYLPLCHYEHYQENVSEINDTFSGELHFGPEFTNLEVKNTRKNIGKVKGPQCAICLLNDRCEGIWRSYAENYGFNELQPISIPEEVKIEVTSDCNFNCDFCYNKKSNDKKEIDKDIFQKIVDSASELSAHTIRLTGGEPLLHANIIEFSKYAKKKGFYVKLNTNGSMIEEKKEIFNYIDEILISIHKPEFEHYNKLILRLNDIKKNNNLVIRCCTIATPENMINLEKYYSFFQKLMKRKETDDYIVDDWFILRNIRGEFNTKEIIDKISLLNKTNEIKTYISNSIPFCSYDLDKVDEFCDGGKNDNGYNSLSVKSNGDIFAGYNSDKQIGSIKDSSLQEIWDSDSMKNLRRFSHLGRKCHECRYLSKCRGGLSEQNKIDPLIPISYRDNKIALNILRDSYQDLKIEKCLQEYYSNSEFQFQYPNPDYWNDDFIDNRDQFKDDINLYIHIPFCKYICSYCTFRKMLLKDQDEIKNYLEYIKKEMEVYFKILKKNIKTIYIGGGTPSAMDVDNIKRFFEILKIYNIKADDEFTFESNPDSLDQEKIALLKKNGVTRISLGVQTLNDKLLRQIKRDHTREDIIKVAINIKNNGLKLNIDALYGLAGQDINNIISDLDKIIKLKPDNITFQKLHILHGTNETHTSITKTMDMGIKGSRFLQDNGYHQFSEEDYSPDEKGFIFQKNHLNGGQILGLGLGAISYTGESYTRNSFNYRFYKSSISSGHLASSMFKWLNKNEKISRYASFKIKGLGFERNEFINKFNIEPEIYFKEEFLYLTKYSLIVLGNIIRPTEQGKKHIALISWILAK